VAIEPRHVALEPSMPAAQAQPVPTARAPDALQGGGGTLREATEDFQRRWVEACIARNAGHLSRAATEAGMDRSNFHRLARKLGVIGSGG
jgi:anaerobic nitric oxide reductase transcription regulator